MISTIFTEIVLGASSALSANDPEPEHVQSEELAENEDSLEQVLEDLSPGYLDTDNANYLGHILDGLSDPDESPNDAEIVDDSNLRQFASALQEAQRHAVKLESEMAKTKHRTPKTYHGNSK